MSGKDKFHDVTTATLRSVAAKDVSVSYSGSMSSQSLNRYNAKEAELPDLDIRDKELLRGAADMKALRLRSHDPKLHRQNAPKNYEARTLYDALEQARCETLGEQRMGGVQQNLAYLLDQKCNSMGYTSARSREETDLADALHILAKESLSAAPLPNSTQNIRELWRDWLQEKLGADGFHSLKDTLKDQAAFSKEARKIAEHLILGTDQKGRMEQDVPENEENCGEQPDQQEAEDSQSAGESQQSGESGLQELESDAMGEEQHGSSEQQPWDFFPDDMSDPGDMDGEAAGGESAYEQSLTDPLRDKKSTYTTYTKEYDEIVSAKDLAGRDELGKLRQKLDEQTSSLQATVTRLAHKLQRKLLAQQKRSWEFDQEDGMLDTSRLSRIVANPNVPLSYKVEKTAPFRDTIVTMLIDNSGSMRGRPITTAAICTDVIAKTLERCGVRVEILGFTTCNWKGGHSRDLWIKNGRPENPGRLNDLRHIIYKNADEPWRKAQKNLGLMLKEGILKENIDGEALAWAYNRIAKRAEHRKILIVISDGAPVDDSTLSANPSNILERDLRDVIEKIEQRPDTELTAIGIGHDVTRYYQNSIKISDVDGLAKALTDNLEKLFEI